MHVFLQRGRFTSLFLLLISFLSMYYSGCRPTVVNSFPTPSEQIENDTSGNINEPSSETLEQGIVFIQKTSSSERSMKGEPVSLQGVVVVSPLFVAHSKSGLQGVFVSDPKFPDQYGGVMVVMEKEFSQELAIGDVINIEGFVDEYYSNTQINARADRGGSVSKTDQNRKDRIQAKVVSPSDVSATLPGEDQTNSSSAERYEGMLIEVQNATVEKSADQYGVVVLEGGAIVDDTFFKNFKPKKGDNIDFIRGVILYSYDMYRILPRFSADISGSSPECVSNDDCHTGRICTQAGHCERIVCEIDADCKDGEFCETGEKRCGKPRKTTTIPVLQDPNGGVDRPKKGDPIALQKAIATTNLFRVSKNLNGFYVSDPAFPKNYGGILVVAGPEFEESIRIGDELTIHGSLDEYRYHTQLRVSLSFGGKIEKTGHWEKEMLSFTEVEPSAVKAEPSDKASPDSSPAEPFEGMLIQVSNLSVIEEANPDTGEVALQGGVLVDNKLYREFKPKKGEILPYVRGILEYSFDRYRLLPRSGEDIAPHQSACSSQIDCKKNDPGTSQGKKTLLEVKIQDIQDPSSQRQPLTSDTVILKDVIVTSPLFHVSKSLKGFFVSDGLFHSSYNGVMIVVEASYSEELQIGDEVTVSGTLEEFRHNTQIHVRVTQGDVIEKTGQEKGNKIKAIELQPHQLPSKPQDKSNPDQSPSEPFEGMLVHLKGMKVQKEADNYGVVVFENGLLVDDSLFKWRPSVGEKFEVTGLVQYAYDAYRILPRGTSDIVKIEPN